MLGSFRFSHDRPAKSAGMETFSKEYIDSHLSGLLHRSVKIKPETFPKIASVINLVESRLITNGPSAEVFVHSDPNMQASCLLPEHFDRPIILISSSIVKLLDDLELASVIGHEIGHAVYKHSIHDHSSAQGLEHLQLLAASRSAEISADRAGLLASRDINSSVSALIKITTGLGAEHIRFDLQALLSQFNEILERGLGFIDAMSTHPLFLLRIRALIMFSNSVEYNTCIGRTGKGSLSLEEVDRGIIRDLDRISGICLDELHNEIITKILVLASLSVFTADGKFSKEEQSFFQSTFGDIDISSELSLAKEQGHRGILFELRKTLNSIGGVSEQEKERMRTFFAVLYESFPPDDTLPLKTALNSLGYT
jgi:hypothetical protein